MQKIVKVNGLDCPNCAAKLEKAINKLDGVNSAIISFATSKLAIDIDDDKFDKIFDEVVELAKKLEPDWEIEK